MHVYIIILENGNYHLEENCCGKLQLLLLLFKVSHNTLDYIGNLRKKKSNESVQCGI